MELSDWVVGRTSGAAAAFQLLADRATRTGWPEFAEFDCYSCHHDLSRGHAAANVRSNGNLQWNEPSLLTAVCGITGSPNAQTSLVELRRSMGSAANQKAITDSALAAADVWRSTAAASERRPIELAKAIDSLAQERPRRWDDACHLYYALMAISRMPGPSPLSADDPRLLKLRALLRLPRSIDGARFASPKDFDQRQQSALFAELLQSHTK